MIDEDKLGYTTFDEMSRILLECSGEHIPVIQNEYEEKIETYLPKSFP